MRPPFPLYLRLTLALILPLILAAAVGSTLAIRLLENSWRDRVHDQLVTATDLLADGDLPFTPVLLQRIASLQHADFAMVDATGAIGLSTLPQIAPEMEAAARNFVTQAEPARDLLLDVGRIPHLVLLRTIAGEGGGRFRAVLAVGSLADAERAAARSGRLLALSMLGATTLIAALSYWLVRGVTRPLERVAQMADRIALGERAERLHLVRGDEVGALARAIDAMAGKLTAYEQQLEARARVSALGELAARTAHELRNPLTAIKLHLQLLQEEVTPAQSRRIARVIGEVRRLELVTDATLAVGQDQPLVRSATDVGALVAEVLELMGPALAHRGIRIESRLGLHGPSEVDPRKLKQVLLNLIVNAADALPDGGRIRVTAEDREPPGWTRISVEDSGAGIAPERREQIFASGASDKPFGFGLGLAVSRDIAQQHGGRLRADSGAELGGARFVLELPDAGAGPVERKS